MSIHPVHHSTYLPSYTPPKKADSSLLQYVQKIALGILKDISMCSALITPTLPFFKETKDLNNLMVVGVFTIIANIALNFFTTLLTHREDELQEQKRNTQSFLEIVKEKAPTSPYHENLQQSSNFVRRLQFLDDEIRMTTFLKKVLVITQQVGLSLINYMTINTLIHEAGHFYALKLFYKNINPKITLLGLNGGYTSWEWKAVTLSPWGEKVGGKTALAAVYAAGSFFATVSNVIGIAFGHYYGGSIGLFLQIAGFYSAFNHMHYALSALSTESNSHDFFVLKQLGFSPYICAATIIIIPCAIKALLLLIDYCRSSSSSRTMQADHKQKPAILV